MSKIISVFKGIATAILLIVGFFLPFAGTLTAQEADLTDESVLLQRLARADADEALGLDRQLQALWSKSGSPSMDLLLKRGRDAMEVHDTRAAIEHLTALTDHAPDFAEGWHTRAQAYFEAELYGPAVSDLEHALTLNPNNYNAIFGLGTILELFGDKKAAWEAYQRVLAIHPYHEDVTKALERLRPEMEGEPT